MRKAILKGINWSNPFFANEFLIRIYSNISDFHLIEKKNPKYIEYFVNRLKTIVLEYLQEYFSISTYNYEALENLIKVQDKNDIYFNEWEEADLRAMELLGIKDVQQFSEKFSKFIYNDAPLLVGNFEPVLNNKVLKRIKAFRDTDIMQVPDGEYRKYANERDEIEKIDNMIQNCFNPAPFDIMAKLHHAVLGLLNFPETN